MTADAPPTPETGDPAPTPDPPAPPEAKPDDIDAIKAALKKANKEAETARLKVKEYEDAQLTEQEKQQRAITEAVQRAEEAEAKATRAEVAAAKGVPLALLPKTGTQEDMEAAAEAALAFRSESTTPRPPAPNPQQGANGGPSAASPADEFAGFLTGQLQK